MTWLAPWALGAGALGMLGVLVAHLLTRQRPRALSLATARFLPAGMLEATTVRRTPADRWWLLLRLLVLALLALGVTQPIATISRVPTRTVLLLDRTLPAAEQSRLLSTLGEHDAAILFDTTASLANARAAQARSARTASLSAAFSLAARVRDSLARGTDALRFAIASPMSPHSLDPATQSLRELLPDSIAPLPFSVPADSVRARGPITVRADANDAVRATALLIGDSVAPSGAIVTRLAALSADDSLAARNGATVLWWPAAVAADSVVRQAMTVGHVTWIAPMSRDSNIVTPIGTTIGWWADGTPAVRETRVGAGCIISLRAGLPRAGDQTLSLTAQAWLTAVLTACDPNSVTVHSMPAWLEKPATRAVTQQATQTQRSPWAPWLIGAALVMAGLELLLRLRGAK